MNCATTLNTSRAFSHLPSTSVRLVQDNRADVEHVVWLDQVLFVSRHLGLHPSHSEEASSLKFRCVSAIALELLATLARHKSRQTIVYVLPLL